MSEIFAYHSVTVREGMWLAARARVTSSRQLGVRECVGGVCRGSVLPCLPSPSQHGRPLATRVSTANARLLLPMHTMVHPQMANTLKTSLVVFTRKGNMPALLSHYRQATPGMVLELPPAWCWTERPAAGPVLWLLLLLPCSCGGSGEQCRHACSNRHQATGQAALSVAHAHLLPAPPAGRTTQSTASLRTSSSRCRAGLRCHYLLQSSWLKEAAPGPAQVHPRTHPGARRLLPRHSCASTRIACGAHVCSGAWRCTTE